MMVEQKPLMFLPPSLIQIWVSSRQEEHGRLEEILPSFPPPHASSTEELCGIKLPRPQPVLRLVPKTVQNEAAINDCQVLWCCLRSGGRLEAGPGSWVGSNKSP